jgi:NAD(P)-dependent dehydrogenase (short-subunit alcohol dehydrogenase family)/predicted ester cyclase
MPQPVLITGCSSGIGLATARYLAERGVHVYATVRSEADAVRVGAIQGVTALVCDVTDDAQVARLRDEVEAREEGLWGLVHNAGIAQLGHLTGTSLDDLRAVFEVNVFGVHRVTNAFADLVVAAKGRIVTMSSLSGTLSSAPMGVYSMSKHALEAYTDALAAQMAPLGVHVCAVAPGNFASAIASNAVRRFDPPDDAHPELRALFAPDADTSRSQYPGPDPVAEAVHAALFDEVPMERYLVVPDAGEADATLRKAAQEWVRLNASTPHRWSLERLASEVLGVDPDAGDGAASALAEAGRNEALLRGVYQRLFVDWDLGYADEVLAPDFWSHDWPDGFRAGPDGFRDFYAGVRASAPDARYEVDDVVAAGDRVVVRWRIVGTHTHEWFGVAPTGRPLELEGIAIYRVADGRLKERWVVVDGLKSARRLRAEA